MSERFHATLDEVATRWSLEDLMQAHELLDAFEAAEAAASARARGRR